MLVWRWTFLGHMAEDEGLQVLRGAFALYIGYPFIRRDRIRRTSFPAKLATYVQAARPLLVHTPWDSSLTPLFAFQPFTIPWVDEDVRRGARLLASAWRDASLRVSQHEAAKPCGGHTSVPTTASACSTSSTRS